jgi:hypothetical protein
MERQTQSGRDGAQAGVGWGLGWASRHFGLPTFVGLLIAKAKRILNSGVLRLEDVASGYWTLSAK